MVLTHYIVCFFLHVHLFLASSFCPWHRFGAGFNLNSFFIICQSMRMQSRHYSVDSLDLRPSLPPIHTTCLSLPSNQVFVLWRQRRYNISGALGWTSTSASIHRFASSTRLLPRSSSTFCLRSCADWCDIKHISASGCTTWSALTRYVSRQWRTQDA